MSTSESINLAGDLPNEAIDLAESKPDVRQAFSTTTSGASGDITAALADADNNNQLLELGSGTYTISGSVSLGGSLTGLVGAGSGNTTIEISGTHNYLFGSVNCSIAVIEGVTFDMRGGGECGYGRFETSDQGWFEDVVVRGQRDRIGNGTGRFSWMFEAVNSGATNFIHRFHQPDGDAHYSGEDTVGHAIPFSADPDHEGLNVWKECHVEGFTDNGYYTGNSPSRNVFWNSTAKDNRAGNFRIDTSDIIVGGSAELTSNAPGQATGQGIAVDYPSDVIVIGCQFVGDSYSDLVQTRQEAGSVTFDRCVVHGTDSDGDLARFDGGSADVSIHGGWWLDEGGGGIDIESASVSANSNWRYRGNINGTMTIAGQTYSNTSGSDAGLEDPQPFPSFHFDGVESGAGTDYGSVGGTGGGTIGGPQAIDGSDSPGSRWGLVEPRTATVEGVPEGPISVTVEPQWFNTGVGTGGGTGRTGGTGGIGATGEFNWIDPPARSNTIYESDYSSIQDALNSL